MTGAHSVLDRPLPARWGRGQRLKNGIIYGAVRLGFFAVRWTPLVLATLGARLLASIAWWIAGAERCKTLAHLELAFPEWSAVERRRVARSCFAHLARSGVEAAHVDRLARRTTFSTEQRALLDQALAEGKGVVLISGHLGNWELLAQVLAAHYPVTTFAKPLYDPRLTRWVHRLRTRGGLGVIWRGDEDAASRSQEVFAHNGILAALIDQDTKVQGLFVPFFGRPAHTPSAPAALALRHGAPVVLVLTQRQADGHVITVERVEVPDSGDREADVRELTARLSAGLERVIRMAPEQWVWMHRRWKTRPAEEQPESTP